MRRARRRALYQRACETTISGAFKGSLNHGSLKHDPDKARVSKESRTGTRKGEEGGEGGMRGKIFVADSSVARRSAGRLPLRKERKRRAKVFIMYFNGGGDSLSLSPSLFS